jgi:hypothetical protein
MPVWTQPIESEFSLSGTPVLTLFCARLDTTSQKNLMYFLSIFFFLSFLTILLTLSIHLI